MRLRLSWLVALSIVACTGGRERATTSGEALSETAPSAPDGTGSLGMLPAEPEQTLDERADGAVLFGTVLPAPRDGDPERVMILRTADAQGRSLAPGLERRRVLDARFAGEGVLTLGDDHVLRYLDDAEEVELDAQVEAPLAVAADCVAFARGEMPFFELVRVDLRSLRTEELTHDLAPVWSPALSPDGTSVVFASSAHGRPQLMRLDASGTLTTLAPSRVPSSPRAPRWIGSTLHFEDEAGAAQVDLASTGAP